MQCLFKSYVKRDVENPIFNTWSKTTSAISQHVRDQQVSAYNQSQTTIIQSHGCKEILISVLHANKMGDEVLLYVFNIGFSASLFSNMVESCLLVEMHWQGSAPAACAANLLLLGGTFCLEMLRSLKVCFPEEKNLSLASSTGKSNVV